MPFVVPDITTFAQGTANSLSCWGDDPRGDWQEYNATLATMFDEVYGLVVPQGSPDQPGYFAGWSLLLDVDNCPTRFLPYLGQFVGVFVPPGTSDSVGRSLVQSEQGMARGTPGAMQAAALRNLTGTQFLAFRERTAANGTADAYHVLVGYRPDECPDRQALINAVEAVKPGGIQVTYISSAAWTWNEAVNNWAADTMTWQAAQTTQP